MTGSYDLIIVGGGIVGLATGVALNNRFPHSRIALFEKEPGWAAHQSSHNSGVIHSGLYYAPGSLKAGFCLDGNRSMVEFCRRQGIKHEVCGKVVVAVDRQELPLLDDLYRRGLAHGLSVSRISGEQLKEIEPHVTALEAIRVPTTGIVDFKEVALAMAAILEKAGQEMHLNAAVREISDRGDRVVVATDAGEFSARRLINCAGLHSDRIAKLAGVDPGVRIVPFRGEYFQLSPEKSGLVKNLIYPVPNPDFPFLGVHLTRMINGEIHAGPNAVLGLKREGYNKTDFDLKDFAGILAYSGFWRFAAKNFKEGAREMVRSFSKKAFLKSVQRLIPEIEEEDLLPAAAGVRAQAILRDGTTIHDFLIVENKNAIHVCNAPSPAATASIEIGNFLADQIVGGHIGQPVR